MLSSEDDNKKIGGSLEDSVLNCRKGEVTGKALILDATYKTIKRTLFSVFDF